MSNTAYAMLTDRFGRLSDLYGAMSILGWDQQVMMPIGAAEPRARQLAALTEIAHDQLTHPDLPDLAAAATGEALDPWQARNLALMRRSLKEASAISTGLAVAIATAQSKTEFAWREARKKSDYKSLLLQFTELLNLTRQSLTLRGEAFGLKPYDAALDAHQTGLREQHVLPLFDDLAEFLPNLLEQVLARQASLPPAGPVPSRVAAETQKAICEALVRQAGFDFTHGRLDVSTHPFCGGHSGDIRLTTRYSEGNFLGSIMSTIHETGHALYEMGLPQDWRGQPVGASCGMMIHESQSLIMEMQAGLSPEFAGYLARKVAEATGEPCSGPDLYRHMSEVERSFIRVEADEVTYPLHVILRTRLERALLSGDLAPADLPGAWKDGFRQLIGLTPPDDARGCLQDPHWYGGAIGYFPTYTLGAITAAQLFRAAVDADPQIPRQLADGSFAGLQNWLRANLHSKASSLDGPQLIQEATGRPLDPNVFKSHLQRRYLGA